jgi:hypothetical protein
MATKAYMTPQEFAAKISWEGGVTEALEYGLKSTDLNPEDEASRDMRSAWIRAEDLWEEMRLAIERVDEVLDDMDGAE